MAGPDRDVIDALAGALAGHVADLDRAEERRTAFAFDERPRPPEGDRSTIDGRAHVTAALAAVGDPATARLLSRLRDGELSIADLAGVVGDGHDRLAVVALVDRLAIAGLVARELTTDTIRPEPLGAALIDLVDLLSERLEAATAPSDVVPGGRA